jgi:hypothetical protein
MTQATRAERRLDIVSTALLALAALATAWAAYQAREWTGVQSLRTSAATATRLAENRAAALANRQVQIDVATFVQWLDARQTHRLGLAGFYRTRFRPEFRPAFTKWLATRPFDDPSSPPTPFSLRDYRLRANVQAERLEAQAAADSDHAKEANQRADTYMLAVVLFATAGFFAGISTRLTTPAARGTLLGLGCIVFVGAAVWLATFPVHITT